MAYGAVNFNFLSRPHNYQTQQLGLVENNKFDRMDDYDLSQTVKHEVKKPNVIAESIRNEMANSSQFKSTYEVIDYGLEKMMRMERDGLMENIADSDWAKPGYLDLYA